MFIRPKIERDPNVQQLEQQVFNKLQDIVKQQEPFLKDTENNNQIRFVSFEEALKELVTLKNK